ncbi:sperm head and tail associated protein-like [Vicugna pacos]|uniref:Sperm head and tail associated protein-like n=1 Tax=Vicugna pacos TaxID=30538 RepID=A0A6J3B5S9_VICPA
MGSPHLSRDPFFGLTCSPGISSTIGQPPSLPRPILSPPPPPPSPLPQPPLRPGRCSFEPCSPHLGRPCCPEPIPSGLSPASPCVDRFQLVGSPPCAHVRGPYCSWISPPRTPRPCPRGPFIDQHTLCYCGGYPSALVTSPVTSPPLTYVPLEAGRMISPTITPGAQGTCPMISPPLTHRPLGTGLIISPPLAHQPMETRPIISPPLSHRVLETGPMTSTLLSSWSSGKSYNDPPLSPASSPPTGRFYPSHLKRPDSCDAKPPLDPPLGKNSCGPPLSSQAGTSACPRSPQEGSYHYSHLPPEAHIPAPGSPYCSFHLPPGSTGSPSLPQSQVPRKPCFESVFSWETGGSSYLYVTPGTSISDPLGPQESPHSLSSHCPCSAFFPSPPGNQFISPPQSHPCRSYKEPPLPTPVCPQAKSPQSSESKQPYAPHRCHSLVTQHTPDQPRFPKSSTSPPPPSHPSGLSGPSCMVTSITTCSNSCPKELPQETTLPVVAPRTLKTVIPTSLPLRLPCDPVLPNSYAQTSPRGPTIGPPCSTHIYSVVPPTADPCLLSGSLSQPTGPLQSRNQPLGLPCGTYSTPRGPPQPHRQPVAPPCSTHIYSFIPLRTPFDPQNLPIAPRARGHLDNMPCGLHIYSVASRDSRKECQQIPYSCPLSSSKSSSCSTNASYSSTVMISECQSSDSQSKNTQQSRSWSQSESSHGPCTSWSQSKNFHLSRTWSGSSSLHQNMNQDQSESPQLSENQGQSENTQHSTSQGPIKSALRNKSRSPSKSPRHNKKRDHSKSPHHSRNRSKSPRRGRSRSQSKSPHHSKRRGQSKSPRHNKK